MLVRCTNCKTEFNKPPSHIKRVKRVFCSKLCWDTWQTQFQSKTCEICGDTFKVRGRMDRYSTCSKPECRSAKKRGERNGNWRGGATSLHKRDMSTAAYRNWRKAVFERDDYTCQHCKTRGGNLEADHIKPWAYFPKLRYVVSNGRTLCLSCHRKTFKDVFKWRDGLELT